MTSVRYTVNLLHNSFTELGKGHTLLSDDERDNVRAFQLRFLANISRQAYDQVRHSLRHKLSLSSDWVILRRIALLSGVRPVWYDCCVNSCICFLGEFASATVCPDCKEPRLSPSGHPRRYYCYIPLIPRLQAHFQSLQLAQLMQYRANYESDGESVSDIFSSEHYQNLTCTQVVVDGETQPHHHFSDPRDVALGLCTDGYLLF
ncbi:hypothetical protein BV20DRAFT_956223, partial [Pilatotrama ljubarskyi]